jgi:two-component system OmpR family sensor kinase
MLGIGSKLRRHWLEVAWALFAAANTVVIFLLSQWETIPFHFIWVSLTLVYGLRIWSGRTTRNVLAAVTLVTGVALLWSVTRTPHEQPDELAEVPLMAAMFVAMVWHAQREKAATDEVRRLADREHRLLEREREFVRDASHELRTPITVARGHAELIRTAHPGEQAARDAAVVLDELDRLSRISERLLILAAAEHPGFLHPAPVGVEDLLTNTATRWSATAPRRWEVRVDARGSIPADEERLQIALDALMENAVKFTGEDDRIAITGRADGDRLLIEISDTGEGIPPEQQTKIFDRFARVDGGRTRGNGGTGLGLAIVRAVVEAHGGSVVVASVPGKGSTFGIHLPGFRSAAADPASLKEPPVPSTLPG